MTAVCYTCPFAVGSPLIVHRTRSLPTHNTCGSPAFGNLLLPAVGWWEGEEEYYGLRIPTEHYHHHTQRALPADWTGTLYQFCSGEGWVIVRKRKCSWAYQILILSRFSLPLLLPFQKFQWSRQTDKTGDRATATGLVGDGYRAVGRHSFIRLCCSRSLNLPWRLSVPRLCLYGWILSSPFQFLTPMSGSVHLAEPVSFYYFLR